MKEDALSSLNAPGAATADKKVNVGEVVAKEENPATAAAPGQQLRSSSARIQFCRDAKHMEAQGARVCEFYEDTVVWVAAEGVNVHTSHPHISAADGRKCFFCSKKQPAHTVFYVCTTCSICNKNTSEASFSNSQLCKAASRRRYEDCAAAELAAHRANLLIGREQALELEAERGAKAIRLCSRSRWPPR